MKIIHIITGLSRGGAEKNLFQICKDDPINHHLVISLTTLGAYGKKLKTNDIQVFSLDLSIFTFFNKILFLIQLLKKEKPNIIQTWLYHSDLIGGVCAKLAKNNKIIWSVRNSHLKFSNSKISTIIIRFICSIFSHFIPKKIVYNSNYSRRIHEKIGYKKNKSILIYNGFEIDKYKRDKSTNKLMKKEYSISQGQIVFGFIARYDKVKGYDLLFEVLSKYKKYNNGFKLIMVGEGHDNKNLELLRMIHNKNLDKNIILLGAIDNIPKVLSVMDALLVTSYSESFPNVVAEAMLCNVPPISTNVGDVKKIIGKYGWLAESVNSNDYLQRIIEFEKLFNSDKDWKLFTSGCRDQIIKNYSLNKMKKNFLEVWTNQ